MPDSALLSHSAPCLWMSAGLITYRLCDRDFDCDHCPLDAALRRRPQEVVETGLRVPRGHGRDFPEGRYYTSGHWWVQIGSHGDTSALRCGLDVFAAALIAHCSGVHFVRTSGRLATGEACCDINFGLGLLSVGAPVCGTVSRWNTKLNERPDQVVISPYDEGWIMELIPPQLNEVKGLLTAQAVRQQSQFDLLRFRRRVATQTLADDAHGLGRTSADGGELAADLRLILGGAAYTEMLRELIH